MKLRRAKAYKKQLRTMEQTFGFRPPFQVVLDSAILEEAFRCKIPIVKRLQSILGPEVKPMITQCCIRHLYNAKPKNDALIAEAKEFERRRCGHHELEEPLSSLECIEEVVGPTNKHHLLIAANDPKLRATMRGITGTPTIYLTKSIVLLEPMDPRTEEHREQEEKSKFKKGLKTDRRDTNSVQKRKRDDESQKQEESQDGSIGDGLTGDARPQKKKRTKGPKGPNPLSMKKPKKAKEQPTPKPARSTEWKANHSTAGETGGAFIQDGERTGQHKRRRKHKSKASAGAGVLVEEDEASS